MQRVVLCGHSFSGRGRPSSAGHRLLEQYDIADLQRLERWDGPRRPLVDDARSQVSIATEVFADLGLHSNFTRRGPPLRSPEPTEVAIRFYGARGLADSGANPPFHRTQKWCHSGRAAQSWSRSKR